MFNMSSHLSVWIDESEKANMLAIGGVLCEWSAVPHIMAEWRQMKKSMGLSPADEMKWNLPSSHPSRGGLEKAGHTTKELNEAAIQTISSQELTCIVAVMFDQRRKSLWNRIWPNASVRDFYCEALKYVLQRVAEEVAEQNGSSCVVICDKPGLGKKEIVLGSIRRGPSAVEKAFAHWYTQGVGSGPGWQKHEGSLADINFHPSILTSDATYHDMLQIADVVVGLTRNWVDTVQSGKSDQWVLQQMKTVKGCFRRRHGNPDFFGDGLVVWPRQNELWSALQKSLR